MTAEQAFALWQESAWPEDKFKALLSRIELIARQGGLSYCVDFELSKEHLDKLTDLGYKTLQYYVEDAHILTSIEWDTRK